MYTIVARLLVLILLTLGFAFPATAQDGFKVSAVSIGSGETPISSGISGSMDLTTDGGGFMEIMAQSEQAWFMAGKDWKTARSKCSLYASVGHFQSAPWVGPYAGCTWTIAKVGGQDISAGAMTWPGWYLGIEPKNWRNDGVKNPEAVPVGYFSTASVNVGALQVSLSHLNFLDDPTNWLPGVGYTQKVRDDVEVSGSITWNSNAENAMYFVGATWHPKK